jgi:hypothetical protein
VDWGHSPEEATLSIDYLTRSDAMMEAEWLACTDPQEMLEFLGVKASDRKVRLFSVGCCRRVWHFIGEPDCRRAVELAEQFAEGNATAEDLVAACDEAYFAGVSVRGTAYAEEAAYAAYQAATAKPDLSAIMRASANAAAYFAGFQKNLAVGPPADVAEYQEVMQSEKLVHVRLVHCIFGNPFRTVTNNPEWLSWNDGTIPKLAHSIYEERAFERLPILADALEEAGCDDPEILAHCRQPGVHARGCWLVDFLMGND